MTDPVVLNEILKLSCTYISNCLFCLVLTIFNYRTTVHPDGFVHDVSQNTFMELIRVLVAIIVQFQVRKNLPGYILPVDELW